MGLFLYPLPDEYYTDCEGRNYHGGHTRSGHGTGKLDFGAPEGTEVRAMTDGTVIRAQKDYKYPYYYSVWVEVNSDEYVAAQGDTLIIRYYHIDSDLQVGDSVTQGQVIGTVGDSAVTADDKHLHLDFAYGDGQSLMGPRRTSGWPDSEQQEAIALWSGQAGSNELGRCWEVIATPAEYKTVSTSLSGGVASSTFAAVESAVIDRLSTYGCTDDQICGIMGNAMSESTMDPFIYGGGYGLFQFVEKYNSSIIASWESKYPGCFHYKTTPLPSSVTEEQLVNAALDQVDYMVSTTGWSGNSYYPYLAKSDGKYCDGNNTSTGLTSLAGTSGISSPAAQAQLFQVLCERGYCDSSTEYSGPVCDNVLTLLKKYGYYVNTRYYQLMPEKEDYANQYAGLL